MCVSVYVWSTVSVLILSLGAPDGLSNHYTSLHHQDMAAMSAEGRQKKKGKKKYKRTKLGNDSSRRERKDGGEKQGRESV